MKAMRLAAGYLGVLGFVVLALTGCPNDNGSSKSLRVRVVDESTGGNYSRVPNATVVLGDANGAMISYGTTDANGEYTFSKPPANATVSTAMTCTYAYGYAEKKVDAIYDVNVPAVTLDGCNPLSPIGTVTVNILNPPGIYSRNAVYIGADRHYFYNALITQETFTVYQHELQNDGKLSIVALGLDAEYQELGYGSALDQTFVTGMTVTVVADQQNTIQYQMTNMPASVVSVYPLVGVSRKGQSIVIGSSLNTTETSTTINVVAVRDFEEDVSYYAGAFLDRDGDGSADAVLWSGVSGVQGAPSNYIVDFSQPMIVPSDLAISAATGTATPTFSWTGTDAGAARIVGYEHFFNSDSIFASFSASPTRTSIMFPELPEALAEFRPAVTLSFDVSNYSMSSFSGSDDYLAKIDGFYNGTWTIPANSTMKESTGTYAPSGSPSPSRHKAGKPMAGRARRF